MIVQGDCIDVMAGMDPESVDAIVTDPPYDLLSTGARNGSRRINNPDNPAGRSARGFMGKAWDGTGIAFRPETWEAAYRVAKPSAYLLAFGGTRTVHRMTVALEDAGWIIRDMLVWGYASGFPKSKASLKPAWEPIVMARKPGPLRMLAIDECRIGFEGWMTRHTVSAGDHRDRWEGNRSTGEVTDNGGRWPANIVLTDPIFDGDVDGVVGGGIADVGKMHSFHRNGGQRSVYGADARAGYQTSETYGDSGTYSRFFLIPKAARSDREPVLGGQLRAEEARTLPSGYAKERGDGWNPPPLRENVHPTVKPVDLMRHLVRLVTPTGGTVLDPFLGSGTTGLAAEMEGFAWIGIEREAEYVAIAEARLNGTQRGLGLESA